MRDHLGSTATVLDSSGAVVSAQKYYPYGRVRTATGLSPTDKTFTGHQQDIRDRDRELEYRVDDLLCRPGGQPAWR